MNRDRKMKMKEPYQKNHNSSKTNGSDNNSRSFKVGKFGKGGGLFDSRSSRGRNKVPASLFGSSSGNGVNFRVTLDGTGDYTNRKKGGRGRRNSNENNRKGTGRSERNGRRGRRVPPPLMTPQPQSAADLDADLDSYKRRVPAKPVTADDLDAQMDAYNAKRKPKDSGNDDAEKE